VENPEHFGKQPFARFTLEEAKERFEAGDMATINIIMDSVPKRFQVYNLPTEGVVTLCCPSYVGDGTKAEDLTRAETTLASMVDRWLGNMRSVPGFGRAFLLDCPQIGVRETRHIEGDFLLEIEDIFHQVEFPDSIGRGSHPIDTRPRPKWLNDPETSYPPRWYFHIPFRSLLAKGVRNLMVVGRCMSATHEAFGCIRPTVQCMITGEAAGTAAALCVGEEVAVRDLPFARIKEALLAQGVLL
ncbi:MAG: FAD-dependent oxidoreductase, partial [Victivallales bacterium]|nr:FAD-dependent oxidoreductase [Victivallales bacterium]